MTEPIGLADETIARLLPGGAFVLDAPDTVPARWGAGDQVLWAQGESLLIVGGSGVGKTTIGGQLLAGVLGIVDEVLGWPVTTCRRVLYLASDRPRQVGRAFARLFTEDDRAILDDRLVVWQGPPPADLAAHPETLLLLARAADADCIFLDSLKDMALGLSDDAVGAGVNRAIQRVLVDGIEVCALHHQRKGTPGEKAKDLASVYGSTWLTAGAGSVLLLSGEPGDPIVDLRHLKQPAAEVGPLKVEHDHTTGRSSVFRGFDLLRYLRGQSRAVTATDVAHAWFERDKPTENDRRKAMRALDRLVASGLAVRTDPARGGEGGTRAATYRSVEPRLEVVS